MQDRERVMLTHVVCRHQYLKALNIYYGALVPMDLLSLILVIFHHNLLCITREYIYILLNTYQFYQKKT